MEEIYILNALFEFATEGILIVDQKGEIVKINPSAEKLFGYEKDELIGKKVEELIPSKFRTSHVSHRDSYNHSPRPRSMGKGFDLYAQRKDKSEFPVEISLSPFTTERGKFVIAFVIDISERKKSEEKIKNHSNELEKQVHDRTLVLQDAINQLEKTKAELKSSLDKEKELNDMKSRFVSMASHEFRTPLATILSSLALVGKYLDQENEEKRSKHMKRIKSAVTNMTDILNDFLSLSRLEEGKIAFEPVAFDLKQFAEEIIQDLRLNCKNGQRISYQHEGKTEVFLDKKLTKGIFFNLISNAIKFSDEGKVIEVHTAQTLKTISIRVKDSGIGISKDDQEHLFERFYRAKNATNIQGTGLGLNIIAKYLELMNGTVKCESELNAGTTFIITIKK